MATLEQEFEYRKFQHMINIIASAVAREYLDIQMIYNTTRPMIDLELEAVDLGFKIVQDAVEHNKLSLVYEKAWKKIGDRIADSYICKYNI